MLLLLLCLTAESGARPKRIMPVGDSITFGEGGIDGFGGYRAALRNQLFNAGYSTEFVGTLSDGAGRHEGHPAWRIDQVDANIAGWLNAVGRTDIILLHIGTNDFGQWLDYLNAIYRLDALITKIATLSPDTHVIVTSLLPRNEQQHSVILTQFNPFVEGIVEAQIAAGRLVSYLDMYPVVPLSSMPDLLHPNQSGYNKMANAWFGAIERIIEPDDAVPPTIVDARGSESKDRLILTFNRRLDQTSAETVSNYVIDQGLDIHSATLSDYGRVVTLVTGEQVLGNSYTLTVNGIRDHVLPTPNTIAANSQATFFPLTPSGYFNNVEESKCYTLVHSLDIQDTQDFSSGAVPYSLDYQQRVGSFDRVAYYLELKPYGGDLQYAWVSMDAFTADPSALGVPTAGTGSTFQIPVNRMNVASNVPSVITGSNRQGNLEFWPNGYLTTNSANVPGASDSQTDFGDMDTGAGNYGSMQIHDTDGAQTVIAFNRWGGLGGAADIGIGSQPSGQPDWTYAQNAAEFELKRLQVLVRTTGDLAPPSLAAASADGSRRNITVRFSEPVREDTLVGANFALDHGVSVLGVETSLDLHEVILQTTLQPDAGLILTVNRIRDSSPSANMIAPDSQIAVTKPSLPAAVLSNVGPPADGYELVYSMEISSTGDFNAQSPYDVDNSAVSDVFSRVAYYLELQQPGGESSFIWVAMDPFTSSKAQLGIPTFTSGARFQQPLDNLDVISNVPGIVTGSGMEGGNIEFWPNGYLPNNAAGVPGADSSLYDFGDVPETGGSYGSMQIHNATATQTLMALNGWGADGRVLDIGIGNSSGDHPDWTSAANASQFSRRVLHVLVLPSEPAPIPAEILSKVPESADYELVYSLDIPANGNLSGGAGFAPYSLDRSAEQGSFSRVAYYLELQKSGDPEPTFAWVSMDAFTAERRKIGIPNLSSGASFQQIATNLNIVSNSGIASGSGLTGNLEFWPNGYQPNNSLPVPGGSGTIYDSGDQPAPGNYGSMQVHNHVAGETIFAINHWGATGNTSNALCVGIGSNPDPVDGATDYTFADNAPEFDLVRRLHVLVLPGDSPVDAPRFVSTYPSARRDRILVGFDRAISDASAHPSHFTIDGGLEVIGTTLMPSKREIAISTSPQAPGTTYTLSTDGGVTSRAPAGTKIRPGSSIQFTARTDPAVLANVPEDGYELIYELAIPETVPRWNVNPIPYSLDETIFGERPFDRVAYLMQLDNDWIYVSFDAHTDQMSKIGIPTLPLTATPFQGIVNDMTVASNVPGIVTGAGITTGNIEFWGGSYQSSGVLNIPNSSTSKFDFGDRMVPGGYGTMQVHNHGASQILFAYNDWGSNANGTGDIGIGTNGGGTHPDWSLADNTGSWMIRKLYVLARPGSVTSTGKAPTILANPCDRAASAGEQVTLSVTPLGDGPFAFQWRRDGVALQGETSAWLELSSIGEGDTGDYDVVVTGPEFGTTISQPATLTLTGSPSSPYEEWRLSNKLTPEDGDLDDCDIDGLANLLEFALGTDPKRNDHHALEPDGSLNGTPIIASGNAPPFSALFMRRDDHDQPGSLSYNVEFSSDLRLFHTSDTPPTFIVDSADDPDYELVSVPFPETTPDGGPVRFFRITVRLIPK